MVSTLIFRRSWTLCKADGRTRTRRTLLPRCAFSRTISPTPVPVVTSTTRRRAGFTSARRHRPSRPNGVPSFVITLTSRVSGSSRATSSRGDPALWQQYARVAGSPSVFLLCTCECSCSLSGPLSELRHALTATCLCNRPHIHLYTLYPHPHFLPRHDPSRGRTTIDTLRCYATYDLRGTARPLRMFTARSCLLANSSFS